MPTILSPYELAQTYQVNGDLTPWASVQEYRRVQTYATSHPEKGSQAVSTALDLPRSRIRPWVDNNSKPGAVRAIDSARELGWLDVDTETEQGRAWARLVAWIFAGGSLSNDYQPTFFTRTDDDGSLSRTEVDVLTTALQTIGVDYKFKDRLDYNGPEIQGRRSTEIIPTDHRTLLGRCLAAGSAPVGEKNTISPEVLPSWLTEASLETQKAFARVYLLSRGAMREFEPQFILREKRADTFHSELVALFERITDSEWVSRSGHNIYLRSEAANALIND